MVFVFRVFVFRVFVFRVFVFRVFRTLMRTPGVRESIPHLSLGHTVALILHLLCLLFLLPNKVYIDYVCTKMYHCTVSTKEGILLQEFSLFQILPSFLFWWIVKW